jgi:hypothetical protein
MMRSFLIATQFLTRLPMPWSFDSRDGKYEGETEDFTKCRLEISF